MIGTSYSAFFAAQRFFCAAAIFRLVAAEKGLRFLGAGDSTAD